MIEIDFGMCPLTAKKTPLLGETLGNFVHRGFIKPASLSNPFVADEVRLWETTKLGHEVCNRFYSVNENGIRFCGECGQELRKQEIEKMTDNIAIGVYAFKNATTASRCVCLGLSAGENITNENYQFRFSTDIIEPRTEFKATMTEEEWKVVHAVVSRALKNSKHD